MIFTYTGGRTTDYANPMYNATLNTKNRATNFSVRNLFSVEYNPNSDLRLIGSFSLPKGMVKRMFSDPPSILLSRELRILQNGVISGVRNRKIFSIHLT